jgi:hypothetical protein
MDKGMMQPEILMIWMLKTELKYYKLTCLKD